MNDASMSDAAYRRPVPGSTGAMIVTTGNDVAGFRIVE